MLSLTVESVSGDEAQALFLTSEYKHVKGMHDKYTHAWKCIWGHMTGGGFFVFVIFLMIF